jgi:hypothetical protein
MRYFFLICSIFLFGCRSEYSKIERQELLKGRRYDAFVEGLQLGMTRNEYFDLCLRKNHEGMFTNGLGNRVQYKMNSNKQEINLLFQPDYFEDKIFQFSAEARYVAWSPWNTELTPERLVEDLKEIFKELYGGNEFLMIKGGTDAKAWTKIDGNRRITIWIYDEGIAKVLVRDLTISNDQLEKQ